jgi:hypothetical protein
MLPFFSNNYYYISLILQAICAIHCIRKGNQQKWIWMIVFLPIVGCIAYIYTEIIGNKSSPFRVHSNKKSFSFGNGIKKLEENLKFSDTFNNRIALADAYLQNNQTDKAILLYEDSLKGSFASNEYVCMQLILAYNELGRYQDIVNIAPKVYNQPQFARTKAHTIYAIALGNLNQAEAAEKEFKLLNGKFSNYESRYHYGLFLLQQQRRDEAQKIWQQIISETEHMNYSERRNISQWISLTKAELNKL